jgi:hypothetical protein
MFFTGKADHCLRSSKINTDHLSCSEFAILISNRFAAEPTFELFDTFRHLEQTGAVTTYIDSFEELMGELAMKDPATTEAYFIANFISGLKDYIKVHLKSHNPATLVQAYSLARNYESSRQKKLYQIVGDGLVRHTSLDPYQLQERKTQKKTNQLSPQDGKKEGASNAKNLGYLAITRYASSKIKFS